MTSGPKESTNMLCGFCRDSQIAITALKMHFGKRKTFLWSKIAKSYIINEKLEVASEINWVKSWLNLTNCFCYAYLEFKINCIIIFHTLYECSYVSSPSRKKGRIKRMCWMWGGKKLLSFSLAFCVWDVLCVISVYHHKLSLSIFFWGGGGTTLYMSVGQKVSRHQF